LEKGKEKKGRSAFDTTLPYGIGEENKRGLNASNIEHVLLKLRRRKEGRTTT